MFRAGGTSGGVLTFLVVWVAKLLSMLNENYMVWNVRGLNSRSWCNVVRELVAQENIFGRTRKYFFAVIAGN